MVREVSPKSRRVVCSVSVILISRLGRENARRFTADSPFQHYLETGEIGGLWGLLELAKRHNDANSTFRRIVLFAAWRGKYWPSAARVELQSQGFTAKSLGHLPQ